MYNLKFSDQLSDETKSKIAELIWDIGQRGNDEYDLEPYVSEFMYKLEQISITGDYQ